MPLDAHALAARVIFDGKIDEDDAEAMSVAETEVIADFSHDYQVGFRLERCDRPARIILGEAEEWVFSRRELP